MFSLVEAVGLGLSRDRVADRVGAGRLHRLHQGVYSVVPSNLLRIEGRWLAAVHACGPGAVLSHTAAAALWDIRHIPGGPIHVTVPTQAGRRPRRGIVIHRSSALPTSQTTFRRTIPVTKSARTLADLRRLLALCRRHGLPKPRTQVIVGPNTVDFLWPAHRLIVETDGFGDHGLRSGFESAAPATPGWSPAATGWCASPGGNCAIRRGRWSQCCGKCWGSARPGRADAGRG